MNRSAVIQTAIAAVVAMDGEDTVSVRSVQEMCGRICGKRLQTRDVLAGIRDWLPVTLQKQTSNAPVTPAPHESAPSSNAPETAQKPLTGERADHNGVVIDRGVSRDSTPSPLPSVVEIPPVLAAVPDAPAKPAKSAPKRVAMASRFAGITMADFGPFEGPVRDLLAVEARLGGRNGEIGEKTLDGLLQRLAMWRADYGDAAFAKGIRVGTESGKGVAYAGGAVRRFDPERDAEPPRLAGRDEEPNASDLLPRLTDLIAADPSLAIHEEDIPAWKRPPFHPRFIAWRKEHPEELIPA